MKLPGLWHTLDMTEADRLDVVFLSLARDCAAAVPGLLRGLEALRTSGLRVRLVVGENGSRDSTRALLEDAALSTGMVQVLDTSFMAAGASRLERMAMGRQFLADRVKEFAWSFGAICVVDLDEPFLESLDPAVFSSRLLRLEADDKTFALCASSRPTYYDLLAFEDDAQSFVGLDKRIQRLRSNPIGYYSLFRDVIYPEQDRLTSDSDIVCTSAFNGLCLYSAETYSLGSYMPTEDAQWICEHITFNRSIAVATGRKMVIDGAFVIPMPPEHGRRALPGFIWQRARKLPRSVAAQLSKR